MSSILSVLIVHSGLMCGLYVFVFPVVLEYLLMGLLQCVCPTDPGGIVWLLNCYSRPYWNRSIHLGTLWFL